MPRTSSDSLEPDVLGEPYTRQVFPLASDSEGDVVATLVHRPAEQPTERAVLHVHGFADYFFHTEYAEWWTEQGYDFYALDLRKYGRSLLPHQTPNYVEDLSEYYAELDEAWNVVTAAHGSVIASAHSTGGLTLPLWLDERQPTELAAVVLNSPWFDMQGAAWLRSLPGRAAIDQLGARQPRRMVPRTVSGVYGRSLHHEMDGEFDYNLDWKPVDSWPIYFGWLRAIRRGHAQLHQGLDIDRPCLVLSSSRDTRPTEVDEDAHSTDIVLDVRQIRRWASSLGPHVTSIGIEGARHDVILSRPEVRERAYAEIRRWLDAYVV